MSAWPRNRASRRNPSFSSGFCRYCNQSKRSATFASVVHLVYASDEKPRPAPPSFLQSLLGKSHSLAIRSTLKNQSNTSISLTYHFFLCLAHHYIRDGSAMAANEGLPSYNGLQDTHHRPRGDTMQHHKDTFRLGKRQKLNPNR